MAYEYDVFISYKSGGIFGDWVHKTFLKNFKDFLENALNRDVNLFVDESEILSGEAWSERIKGALIQSRCLIPILSPTYFRSEWCYCEYNAFREREKRLGYGTTHNSGGLMVPVRIFDGEHFPDFAKKIQSFNCIDFFGTPEIFNKTPEYHKFERLMMKWVQKDLVECINNAPPWSDKFEMWVEKSIEKIQQSTSDFNFKTPILE